MQHWKCKHCNQLIRDKHAGIRFVCDECLHAEIVKVRGIKQTEKPKEDEPTIRDLAPVLRNARRRLVHGLSPDVLHAIADATGNSRKLFHACCQLLYVEAKLTGGFRPLEEGVTTEQVTSMFLGWMQLTSSNQQAGVLQRCVERIEVSLRA